MIKELYIKNRDQLLTFRKHNIFIGLSGSGKTDLMSHIFKAVADYSINFHTVVLIYPEYTLDYNEIYKLCCKIKEDDKQYFILTHNRDIINQFELEDLFIVELEKIYCHDNNKENIDEFAFTGLSNYDFYRSDFYKDESESIKIMRF
jgi:predicted ATPase